MSPAAYSEGLGSKDTGSKIRSVTSKNRMVKPFVPEYPQLSAEQELILCCARTHVEPSQVARVGSLLDSELDWQRLLSYGSRHGVLPLVYENLKRLAPEKVPEVWLLSLERSFKARILCNLRMVTELFEVLKVPTPKGLGAHSSAAVTQDPHRATGWRYVYEVGAPLGSQYLVLFSLGVRDPNTSLLDALVAQAYRKAAQHLS